MNFLDRFSKNSNTKFHQNPSIRSRVVPGGQTDLTKLIVAFRYFANAPKKREKETIRVSGILSLTIQTTSKNVTKIISALEQNGSGKRRSSEQRVLRLLGCGL